jgi:hypothetical protein
MEQTKRWATEALERCESAGNSSMVDIGTGACVVIMSDCPRALRIVMAACEHREYWMARAKHCGRKDALALIDAIIMGKGPRDE